MCVLTSAQLLVLIGFAFQVTAVGFQAWKLHRANKSYTSKSRAERKIELATKNDIPFPERLIEEDRKVAQQNKQSLITLTLVVAGLGFQVASRFV